MMKITSKCFCGLLIVGLAFFVASPCVDGAVAGPAAYDVVWDSPSADCNGSMPLGNGDIGLNAWVEPNGDLVFYIGKTDSWGDNGRLLKLGKVRVRLTPPPLEATKVFSQRLNLTDGVMQVRFGPEEKATRLRLWVDAHRPIIHVEVEAAEPVEATANIELWRTASEKLPSVVCSDVLNGFVPGPGRGDGATVVEPDTVLKDQKGRIGWYHRNIKSVGPAMLAEIQGVKDFPRPDPLLHRTFGAVITASGGERIDDLQLRSPKSKSHRFDICVLTQHPATPEQWLQAVETTLAEAKQTDFAKRRAAHTQWWRDFWNRSWIHAEPADAAQKATAENGAFVTSRAYALQRYINACARRGRYPIKFNGSIFTVPYPNKPGNADFRQWGPGYWWQNTRLPYISMCTSGDFDLMQPLVQMYAKDLVPLMKYRTRRYLGHDGLYIPECIYFWGDMFSAIYGWTPFEKRADKIQESRWHKWEWVSGPELAFMLLDYYDHTLDRAFLRETALPLTHEVLTFFDQHYKTNADGKLVMHPSQAVETWWDCTNPMPELAGLHAVTDRLLTLDERLTTPEERAFWAALKKKLPELPLREVQGKKMLAPAEKFASKKNFENPELYAVFPFRLVAVGRPNIELGREALAHRWDKGNFGWRQDDIFMAYLGLTDQAKKYLVGRAKNKHQGSRFPAFWGPNYDWIPDQDHGGILLKTLQAMILQTDGRKIYIAPAWPKDWNVQFKLHAPYQTVVEGAYRDGKLVDLKVTPPERRKDVVTAEAGP